IAAFCGLSFLLAIKITSKLSNFILHQFGGLHKLWDVPSFDCHATKNEPRNAVNSAFLGSCTLFKLWDFIVPLSLKLSKNTLFSIHFSMRYGIFPSVPEVKCIICVSQSGFL
ncbi:hypothetical protein ACTQ1U_10670, partial [Thermoguttaceae bacterium LCP21S3_D4]